MESQACDQFSRINAERFGNADDVMERQVALSALDLPDVGPVQLAAIGERLLAQTQLRAPLADARPELGGCRGQRRLTCGTGHSPTPSVP